MILGGDAVIARSEATKQSGLSASLDRFAALAMTANDRLNLMMLEP